MKIALVLVLAGAHAAAAEVCPTAEILTPGKGETIATGRPAIEWRALPGVARYRVQIESRVPEGQILWRTDTLVAGTKFVPPAPLADVRAAVKVLVSAECAAAAQPSVIEEPARFFVDLASTCPAPSALEISERRMTWGKVAGAQRYEVAAYSSLDGRSLLQAEGPELSVELPPLLHPAYVMVRARCGQAYSAPAYRVLATPSER